MNALLELITVIQMHTVIIPMVHLHAHAKMDLKEMGSKETARVR